MTSSQISMMLNIGSLVSGFGAWILAFRAIITPRAIKSHKNTVYSFCSCIISLVFQLFEISNRVSISDYAAIEDTIRAVLIAAIMLVAVTVVLNIAALVKAEKK